MPSLVKLVQEKNEQRAALKKEYFKLLTHPNAEGHVFDPAIQRHIAMRATRIEHFRETPKNLLGLIVSVIIPITATWYMIKTDRESREAAIRSGNVAYKDRLFKLQ